MDNDITLETNIFEFFFLFDMILNFFTDFQAIEKNKPKLVREFDKIVSKYLETNFGLDLLSLLPLQMLPLPYGTGNLFYLLKIIRLRVALKEFNIGDIMRYVKKKR